MHLQKRYLILWLCFWMMTTLGFTQAEESDKCADYLRIKNKLIELSASPDSNQAEEILKHLQHLSTEDFIKGCWNDEMGKLVSDTIGALISHNAQNPQIIKQIADYLTQVRGIFEILIPLPRVPASPRLVAMVNSLIDQMKEVKNKNIQSVLNEKTPIEIRNGTNALNKMELWEQGLVQYAEKQQTRIDINEVIKNSAVLSDVYKQIKEIKGQITLVSPKIPLLFSLTLAIGFIAIMVILFLITMHLKRLKEIVGDQLKEVDVMSKQEQEEYMKKSKERMIDRGPFSAVPIEANDNLPITTIAGVRRLGNRITTLERQLNEKPNNADISDLIKTDKTIETISNNLSSIKTQMEGISEEFKALNEAFSRAQIERQQSPTTTILIEIEEKIKKLSGIQEEIQSLPDLFFKKMVIHERTFLKKIWQDQISEAERAGLMSLAKAEPDRESEHELYNSLEATLKFSPELLSFYSSVLQPMRQFHQSTKEIQSILREFNKKEVSNNPIQDLFDIKQKINFLSFLQYRAELPELLSFNKEKWFKEKFLNFVDQFLRKYQREEFAGTLSPDMEIANQKTIDLLGFLGIEPIFIELGKTPFDPRQHNGISKIYETYMNNGVIAEVIKSGFRKINGEVFIMPEVIVNRL